MVEYSVSTVGQSQTANTWASGATPNVLHMRTGFRPNGATNPYCVANTNSVVFLNACGVTAIVPPGGRLTGAAWTGSNNVIIVPQPCNSSSAGLAAASGANTITINTPYTFAIIGSAAPNVFYGADMVRIGSRVYQIVQTSMAAAGGSTYTITLDRTLIEPFATGQAITCIARAAALPSINPTVTGGPVTLGQSSSHAISVTDASNFSVGDYMYPGAAQNWACVVTAVAGNTITCTTTANSVIGSVVSAGEPMMRGWRFNLRIPPGSSSPPLNTVFPAALFGSGTTVLNQNFGANLSLANLGVNTFRLGGVIPLTVAATGSTPATSVDTFTTTPRVSLSAGATGTGTNAVRMFSAGRGDGVATFNIPDLRGSLLGAAGTGPSTTNVTGASVSIGSTGLVTRGVFPGAPFIYAGP